MADTHATKIRYRPATDITGRVFGRLTVLHRVRIVEGRNSRWRCLCSCGELATVRGDALRGGHVKSCGCYARDLADLARKPKPAPKPRRQRKPKQPRKYAKHNLTAQHSLYQTWASMIQRTTNPRRKDFQRYGARGITVCDRWRYDFAAFASDMGERPEGMTLERIDNALGYTPENCKWDTRRAQNRNQRCTKLSAAKALAIRSDRRTQAEIAREYGVSPSTVSMIKLRKTWAVGD